MKLGAVAEKVTRRRIVLTFDHLTFNSFKIVIFANVRVRSPEFYIRLVKGAINLS